MKTSEKKIGLIGCGHRGIVGFLKSLKDIERSGNVVALFDSNPTRLNFANDFLNNPECKTYNDFNSFIAHPGLTDVIVATPDNRHTDFVIDSFNAGKDVICEKPIATNLSDARKMLNAQGENHFRVAFNMRYNSVINKVKQFLQKEKIGKLIFIESRDIIGWEHGADYFRRWHRLLKNSGGLFVHKSVHNFDVMNWWAESVPVNVFATARKTCYLPEFQKGERCSTCSNQKNCKYFVNLEKDIPGQEAGIDKFYKKMYADAYHHDHYARDTCVFHKDNELCDSYHAMVNYKNDIVLNYTAFFAAPYEDRRFVLQGTEGRIELSQRQREIKVFFNDHPKEPEIYNIAPEDGGHGGSDIGLVKSIFNKNDPKGLQATSEDAYWSLALASAANKSVKNKQVASIEAY